MNYNKNNSVNTFFSKDSILDYSYRSDNSLQTINSEKNLSNNGSRYRRRSSILSLRRTSRSSVSSNPTYEMMKRNSNTKPIDKKKESEIKKPFNKSVAIKFPKKESLEIKSKKLPTFTSAIMKLNKNMRIEKEKEKEKERERERERNRMEIEYDEDYNESIVMTSSNHDVYKVENNEGKTDHCRNGPLVNNYFKKYDDNKKENEPSNISDMLIIRNKKDENSSNIKSILKKPQMYETNPYKDQKSSLENNLLVKLAQDDINNEIYTSISLNKNNEKNERKHSIKYFEKMTKINENDETSQINENEVNYNENDTNVNANENENEDTYEISIQESHNSFNNDININNENESNGENIDFNKKINNINKIEIHNDKNETDNNSNVGDNNTVTTENYVKNNNNTGSQNNEYNREDLLNLLKVKINNNKEDEPSNENYELIQERNKHDQVLLSKIEIYQDILDIANISALELVDLIEQKISIKPVIRNIIYSMQQNVTLYSEEDIRRLEDMFIMIKSYRPKPGVVIKNNFDIIVEEVIKIPYPKTTVQSIKELLNISEPNTELDISVITSRPKPFLLKNIKYEEYNVKKKKK
jgi:hypothetical protein